MNERVKVKEPPRDGDPGRARYHLKDGWELIGWTNNREVAFDWRNGFGPVSEAHIEDREPARKR